ncbi:MAG: hypothetical protein Q8Q73_15395 [Stagnimonas sp.]|nr:hypothetical protein [Stagnimonas sp.]
MNKLVPLVLAALIAGSAHAQSTLSEVEDSPGAGAMAFDLIFIRPLGLVSTVLGTGVFILQLPFNFGAENNKDKAFEKLVKEPARYTFTRQLGSTE